MSGGYGGFQPPQWQQGFNPVPQRNGPPPAKKPRSTAIVTRYAPPPGYRGPGQPPALFHQPPVPYHQPAWQQPQQVSGYGPSPYYGYQAYAQPHAFQQPQYPGHPPHQQYAPHAPPVYGYYPPAAHGYPAPPQPGRQGPMSSPHNGAAPSWQQGNSFHQQRRHNSAPFPSSVPDPAGQLDETNKYSAQEGAQDDGELESEYWGAESFFARHPEAIDPELSLGHITWNAPLPTKRPLPATFAEAEVEALAPRKPHPSDDESISDYFINSKRHEAFLSIRQSETWEQVRGDLVFREFPAVPSEVLSISDVLAKYKDRPDPNWMFYYEESPTPEPEPLPTLSEPSGDAIGGAMEIDDQSSTDDKRRKDDESEQDDALGNLEQALEQNGTGPGARQSRANSAASASAQTLSRPKVIRPVRDQSQEDILAALGVTGSPKAVWQTPGPAVGAPPPGRHNSTGSNTGVRQTSRHNSVSSNPVHSQVPPPPPPPPGLPPRDHRQRSASYEIWLEDGRSHANGYGTERRSSSASQHTATGSDFHPDNRDNTPRPSSSRASSRNWEREDAKNGKSGDTIKEEPGDTNATPRPKYNRTDSRKRGYDDSEDGVTDNETRQDGDETPRQRYKQPRVQDAYRRRW